ncbi:MAG: FAD-binding protein, partial [Methylobacter sp.]|uniref:FAD-binding protein n=1 Tax=Methylobacter sp. TaxID=2051955 RepID=UPI0025D77925
MREQDLSENLQQQVQQAAATGTSLRIVGSNSKAFYGGDCQAAAQLPMAGHCGIIDYEPSELVVTARSGTPLNNIASLLAQHRQMLAFEPPGLGEQATLGGTLACGFSGPRRPFVGSARDFMLGCRIINGDGEVLNFGGRVMKNVAGFDVSRLMVGALGSLGVLLEVSLRVLPIPE